MNKKLIFAAGLTALMAACSSEDVLTGVQNSQDLSMFEGIEKVNAEFNWGVESRLANRFGLEADKDMVGFAWLTDGDRLEQDGSAYQNHPLYAVSENGLKPKTSIYVGKYFSYAPYDESVVAIENINFSIPQSQDMLSSWNGLAKNAIYISPIWTNVQRSTIDHVNEAGIDKNFTIYPRKFSNAVRLNLAYANNEIDLYDEVNDETKAFDPEIFEMKVSYFDAQGQLVSIDKFQYAPTEEPGVDNWEQHILAEEPVAELTNARGAEVVLKAVEGIKNVQRAGYTLEPEGKQYFADRSKTGDIFRYNALPALTEVGEATEVLIEAITTYGKITIKKPVNEIAYTAYEDENGNTAFHAQPDGVTIDEETETPLEEGTYFDFDESFVQVLGKNGELKTDVDFSTVVMDSMHVQDDAHLLQLLRYLRDYKTPGSDYQETDITLLLDGNGSNEFEISKASIELTRYINQMVSTSGTPVVKLELCDEHNGDRIVLKDSGEICSFNQVFGKKYPVYLSDNDWTWGETLSRSANDTKTMGKVTRLINRGTITVKSDMNVNAKYFDGIENLAGSEIIITVKMEANVNVLNNGLMTINDDAEYWAGNGFELINNATSLDIFGTINNNGVITVTETATPSRVVETEGQIINYGLINHNSSAANKNVKTYITYNQTVGASFTSKFAKGKNMFGTIMLKNKFDNVSVKNETNEGFIKYAWNAEEDAENEENVYQTPLSTYYKVKYNYLIVDENIKFVEEEAEIKFIEIAEGKEVIIAAEKTDNYEGLILEGGLVLAEGAELNIQLQNTVSAPGAFVQNGIIRVGGEFFYETLATYLGGSEADHKNIGKY